MQDFRQLFEGVEDPRRSNAARRDLCEMPAVGLLCIMCGGEGCVDMSRFGQSKEEFLRQFMSPGHGIPSHDAFSDLFRALDPRVLQDALLKLVSCWVGNIGDAVAVDGKALRQSFRDAAARSPSRPSRAWFSARSGWIPSRTRPRLCRRS